MVIRIGGEDRFAVAHRVVHENGVPVWQYAHRGADLLSGDWDLLDCTSLRRVAGFHYLPSAYRHGEDLLLRVQGDESEYLFRRQAADEDRWLLAPRDGETLLESLPSEPGAPHRWQLALRRDAAGVVLWPLVCLLAFDRMACGRL